LSTAVQQHIEITKGEAVSVFQNLVVVTLSLITDMAVKLFLDGRAVEAFIMVFFSIFVFETA